MIVGVDPGTKRVGLAIADLETRFARPVDVVDASSAVEKIAELTSDQEASTVVVGKPVSLSGEAGAAVASYRALVSELKAALPNVQVVEFDERLTSVIAEKALRSAGLSSKKARGKVDAVAAQVMLQGYLDSHREVG